MDLFQQLELIYANKDLVIAAIREKYPEKDIPDDYLDENFFEFGNGDFVEVTLDGYYLYIYV